MPSIGLTTVQQIKDYLAGVGEAVPAAHEALLQFIIKAKTAEVERFCRRKFGQALRTGEVHTGIAGQQHLFPHQWPLGTVTTVTLDGVTIAAGEADENYRKVSDAAGEAVALFRAAGWESKPYGISLTYQAGYVLPGDTNPTLPADIERAVVELCASAYQQRGKAGLTRESFEGLSVDFERWPAHIVQALAKYKRPLL